MNYYSQMYITQNKRLYGKSDKYLHFHLLLECHISFWGLLFQRKKSIDKLAETMEWCYELGDESNMRPLKI